MSVDNCFRDTEGKTFNEFMPANLVLGPYVNELQAAADMHIKEEAPDNSMLADGEQAFDNIPCKAKSRAYSLSIPEQAKARLAHQADVRLSLWTKGGPALGSLQQSH